MQLYKNITHSEYELVCNFNCLETERKCGFIILLRPL